jgi:lipopolysaccharide export system ATP-binding protein
MLKVDSVQLAYAGRKILQDIYLDCNPGEIVGILAEMAAASPACLK